jgi:hypothetical protein
MPALAVPANAVDESSRSMTTPRSAHHQRPIIVFMFGWRDSCGQRWSQQEQFPQRLITEPGTSESGQHSRVTHRAIADVTTTPPGSI